MKPHNDGQKLKEGLVTGLSAMCSVCSWCQFLLRLHLGNNLLTQLKNPVNMNIIIPKGQ
jgi:hypothetical protein